jgi:hypothetical protein
VEQGKTYRVVQQPVKWEHLADKQPERRGTTEQGGLRRFKLSKCQGGIQQRLRYLH